ncbi:MAG TPA: dolichyl-phosphate beta-glucosyltransferase [Chloroflexota bacterium]|nr:dolichyl-phosphate beta-glucosyltransferase [Chloroflexota bacterium]
MSEKDSAAIHRPRVDAVIPVYNEERDLERSVATLRRFLREHGQAWDWRIVIADNASTDRTLAIAEELQRRWPGEVAVIHLDQKGRGRALRRAWTESDADIVCYMDVDLSTDLQHLPSLIDALTSGYDVAFGSRLAPGARVTRGLKREIISRCYNLLIKLFFWHHFRDAQCGFKGITRQVVQEVVPLVQDQAWFFDTELLLIAEKNGYRLKEIPVTWRDDPDSRVKILRTAWEDLKGLWRLKRHFPRIQRSRMIQPSGVPLGR